MADNSNSRFRPSDPYGRGPGPSGPANDPLAELARLIGQNDPFAEFGNRPQGQPEQGAQGSYDNSYPTQPYNGQPTEPYLPEPAPGYSPEPAHHYQPYEPPRFSAAPQPNDDWPGSLAPTPYQQPADAYQQQPESYGVPPPMRPVPGFDTPVYADSMVRPPDDFQRGGPSDPLPSFLTTPDRQPQQPGFEQHPYAQQSPLYPTGPDAGAMPAPHDDEFYDDAPRGGRRKGLLTVAAVLALAVVGTAGAVGYRSYFGGPGTSGPPPVIRASGEPSKVAPPASSVASSADPSANKFNFDRFADRSKDEQVVRREEKPLDQKDLVRSGTPRTVLDGAPVPSSARTGSAGNPPSTIGDPKRVRTVPIRPDQGDVAANSPSTTPENLLPSPPARQGNNFPPPPARQVESRPEPAAPQTTARATPPRTVTASRAPAPAAATSGTAPLSLSPDGGEAAPPPAASAYREPTPSRQASVAPAPSVPRATSGGGGRFHVQVSSQKSETDAESSYRSIQSKYSGVLGGQPHTVRRADLGSKGVFYRAMVGPFGSREQAVQLCSSLKSAGGDCVVQAN